jgi:hypothetical protein
MTGGGLNLVGIATEVGATSLLITEKEKFVISNNIEAPRMIEEEGLEKQGFTVKTFPWYEDQEVNMVKDLGGEGPVGCDVPFPHAVMMAEEIARLRYSLTPAELERYRWLGEKVSLAMEKTLLETKKGEKESEVVARLCQEIWKDRIDPIGLMAAADDRMFQFRHPIPTEKRVEKYLMVSINARKWGLVVCLTRSVYLGELPAPLKKNMERTYLWTALSWPTPVRALLPEKSCRRGSRPIEKEDFLKNGNFTTRGDRSGMYPEIIGSISKRPTSSRRTRPSPGTHRSPGHSRRTPS